MTCYQFVMSQRLHAQRGFIIDTARVELHPKTREFIDI